MSQNNDGLNFHLSYNELFNQGYEKEVFLTRDQTDLASRGITTARITAFGALRTTLFAITDDETMRALISVAIAERDVIAASAIVAIREVLGIAKNTFGENDARYKTFGGGELSAMNTTQIRKLCDKVVERGNIYLTLLQPKGLTAAMLTAVTAFETTLDTKIKAVDTAEDNQLTTTQTRHNTANALFSEMRDMCDTARVYWADRNPLKASEYIIYDTVGNSQQRNGIIESGSVVYREFTGLNVDANFKIRVNEGNDLVFYFSQTEGGSTTGASVTVGVDPNNYTDATAVALGYDAATGYIKFNIRNNGSVESSYRVVME